MALATVSGSAFGAESCVSQAVVRAGVRCAGAPHARAGRASNGLRGRAAGTRDPPTGGAANRVPRHSRAGSSTAESKGFSASLSILATRATAGSTSPTRRSTGRNTVERFRSDGTKAVPSSRTVLLAVPDPYGNHNGGHLAFGPDGRLYTSIGDGGSGGDPENRSQNMQSQFGKLLALDVSKPAAGWSIEALGLRNPWRFSFDRATGDLYIGDVGQGAIEEMSFTPRKSPGLENYGWDLFEGSRRYEEKAAGPGKLVFPVAEYNHDRGCSVTGGFVYRGTSAAERAGPVHLRRLLQWHRVELPDRARRCDRSSRRAVQGRQPELLRRERSRRALRALPRRHDLPRDLASASWRDV